MENKIVMQLLSNPLDGIHLSGNEVKTANYAGTSKTVWDYWQNWYYPNVIRESYPVYIQERAMDKGHKAFEIIKSLMDKKIVKLEKVGDFVEAMDALIKIL